MDKLFLGRGGVKPLFLTAAGAAGFRLELIERRHSTASAVLTILDTRRLNASVTTTLNDH